MGRSDVLCPVRVHNGSLFDWDWAYVEPPFIALLLRCLTRHNSSMVIAVVCALFLFHLSVVWM